MKSRTLLTIIPFLALTVVIRADEPKEKAKPNQQTSNSVPAGFRTVDTAIRAKVQPRGTAIKSGRTGYLGVYVERDSKGRLAVEQVGSDSPAAKAGFAAGDVVVKLENVKLVDVEQLRELLQTKAPGDKVKFTLSRKGKEVEATATLTATSNPLKPSGERVTLGVRLADAEEGVKIDNVSNDSPAAKAGVKSGDLLLKIDGAALANRAALNDLLADRRVGDPVTLCLKRNGKDMELRLTLAADFGRGFGRGGRNRGGVAGGRGGWDDRLPNTWRKDVYRLAIIGIEYPDVKHNPKVSAKDWSASIFSRDAYNKTSPTGFKVYGSVNDYYHEISCGALRLEGKVFDWVTVSKKRMEYSQGTGTGVGGKTALLSEAMTKLLERDGKDALKNFDGVFFLYAGGRVQTSRGGLYWPHRATFSHNGKRWPYFIVQEGGQRMTNISVFCHEFGHMLGLPDLYARPENPGSEGIGVWGAMSNQIGNGRPQHFSAWSKEQLGWIKPCVIDPTVKQKLILAPIENSTKECFKVLVRPDGSEYYLLENRRKTGFDSSLPAEGLLVWRVVGNRPILEESHGVEGPAGPRVFLTSVPFPSSANHSFTPFTTPSSRAQLGGGLPVHITNISRMKDGRISFYVGYEFE